MTAAGVGGALLVGYQFSARVGNWTLGVSGLGRVTIRALLLNIDEYWFTRRPTTVRLLLGERTWVFDVLGLQQDNNNVTITAQGKPLRK